MSPHALFYCLVSTVFIPKSLREHQCQREVPPRLAGIPGPDPPELSDPSVDGRPRPMLGKITFAFIPPFYAFCKPIIKIFRTSSHRLHLLICMNFIRLISKKKNVGVVYLSSIYSKRTTIWLLAAWVVHSLFTLLQHGCSDPNH